MVIGLLGSVLVFCALVEGAEASRIFPPESNEHQGRSAESLIDEYGPPFKRIVECHGTIFYQWVKAGQSGQPCLVSISVNARGLADETYFEGKGCQVEFPPHIRTDCQGVY